MGIQPVRDVTLIRHAYVRTARRNQGIGAKQQKLAVESGQWLMYRFDPRRTAQGLPAMKLDSPAPKTPLETFWATQTRFQQIAPERSREILAFAQSEIQKKYAAYEQLAAGATPKQVITATPVPPAKA